jgi:tetratricopeptide (TPR) repeat protein
MPPLPLLTPLAIATLLGLPEAALAQSIEHAARLFREARFADARAELLALQHANAGGAEVAYYLGRIATVHNDDTEAIRQFERAVQLEEDNALYQFWLGSALREVTPHVGIKIPLYARRMKKAFERSVELDPEQIDARFGLVQVYASAPRGLGGNRDKARQQAAEIARRNAMRGAIARGFIAEMEEQPAAEELAYQQAIAAHPDSIAGYRALVNMYTRLGRGAQAFAAIERYAQQQPHDRMALYHVGCVTAQTGDQLERGESALRQFLDAPPKDTPVATVAGAHHCLGRIAERRGVTTAAREQYGLALRLDPRSPARKALDRLR